ncbi:MAG: hypothetical protein HN351_11485 [Deltaproteobacteria bacterium]|nr:hypothetical protein [Deltaproteobacteria bacterium]
MRHSIIFLLLILFNFSSSATAFYPLGWDDLMFQMEKRMSWQIARMETVVQVFDPFIKNAKGEAPTRPIELPARSFKQLIHWQDGKVLVVETQDDQGGLLHFYYENRADLLSLSLNDNRSFSTADILPRQLRFRSRYEEKRSRALQELGIVSKEVAYHIRDDNHVFLRVGNLESGHYALLNPKTYELSSLHNRIWQEDGSSLDLTIVFKKYVTYRWQTYAKVTEYYLDKRLFKRMTVSKIRTLSRLPLKKLKKQALNLRRKHNATLQNDYAL